MVVYPLAVVGEDAAQVCTGTPVETMFVKQAVRIPLLEPDTQDATTVGPLIGTVGQVVVKPPTELGVQVLTLVGPVTTVGHVVVKPLTVAAEQVLALLGPVLTVLQVVVKPLLLLAVQVLALLGPVVTVLQVVTKPVFEVPAVQDDTAVGPLTGALLQVVTKPVLEVPAVQDGALR